MNENELLLREMDKKLDSMLLLMEEKFNHILSLLEVKPEVVRPVSALRRISGTDDKLSARPVCLPGDVWGCRVNRPKPEPGTVVTITSRAGKTRTGTLVEKVRGDLLTSDWTYDSDERWSGGYGSGLAPSIKPVFDESVNAYPEEGSGHGPAGETDYPGSDKDDSDSVPF